MHKKIILTSVVSFLIASLGIYFCLTNRALDEKLAVYASCKPGETYEVQKDLLVLEYDYMQIPLVKPGIQVFDVAENELVNARPEMKIKKLGKLGKGDLVVLDSFVEEVGWIPCKGNWYMANPLVKVMTGSMAGKVIGISLLCDFRREKTNSYKSGNIGFMQLNSKYLLMK